MPTRLKTRVKFRSGRQIVRKTLDPTTARYTQQMAAQVKEIEDALAEFIDAVEDVTPEILHEALEPTFQKSQDYTPVDTGRLKKSGVLEVSQRKGGATAQILYGKNGRPTYAVFVHEMVEIPHEEPTRAQFLQSAIEEDFHKIQKAIVFGYRID